MSNFKPRRVNALEHMVDSQFAWTYRGRLIRKRVHRHSWGGAGGGEWEMVDNKTPILRHKYKRGLTALVDTSLGQTHATATPHQTEKINILLNFERTKIALEAYDVIMGKASRTLKEDIRAFKAVGRAFAEDTKHINNPATAKLIAPGPFLRELVRKYTEEKQT